MSAFLSSVATAWSSVLQRYVAFAFKRRVFLLIGALILCVGMGVTARWVKVASQLQALLPAGTESAAALTELETRLKGSSPLYLLVEASDVKQSRRVAQAMYERVQQWPDATSSMYKRDPSYFLDHRLLYLSAEDIEELSEQIEDRRRWEECKRVPGCVNLDKEPPPLPTEEEVQALFEKDPNVKALVSLFGKETSAFGATSSRPAGSQADQGVDAAPMTGEEELGELCDPEARVCTVIVTLDRSASDLEYAGEVLRRSEALFAELKTEFGDPSLNMAVSGSYRNAPMTQRAVAEDLSKTTVASVFLVLLVVFAQFRGWRSLIVLLFPAAAGILWTLGGLGILGASLNLISAFTLAVLAGVGIDFGVHLLTHYSLARSRGSAPEAACFETLRELSPSLAVAAATTSSGFAALAVASFRGFSEMGPIAACGVLMCLLSFFLLFPPLVAWLDFREGKRVFLLREYGFKPWAFLHRYRRFITLAGLVLAGGLAVTGAGLLPGKQGQELGVSFEYNFRNLRPKGVSHGINWGNTLHGTSRNSVYLLADDHTALEQAVSDFREHPPTKIVDADSSYLLIPGGFVPPEQAERLKAVRRLSETLQQARKDAPAKLHARIEEFQSLAAVGEAISVEKMPGWVQDWLVERDGRFGTLGVMYTDLSGADARQMEMLANQLTEWRKRYPSVRFASANAQLGEVTPRLRNEAPTIMLWALLGVLLGTIAVGRSFVRTVTVLLPLMVTVGISVGLMALFDTKVNLYNMLVFPLAFGIGIDGAVYVVWALGAGKEESLAGAARAVLGSTLTSMAGFGALMVSSNPGLSSIGVLSLLMLGVSLVANLVWLPAAGAGLVGSAGRTPE